MTEDPEEEFPQDVQNRLQPFLDCVAYLLAKRWLRDQRQGPAQPPQEESVPGDDPDSR